MNVCDKELLLDAIIKDPGEDTPRLAYADKIREDGDPDRAEFIQLQIQLERDTPDDPARPERVSRKDELLSRYGDVWAGEIARPRPHEVSSRHGLEHVHGVGFRRGFIDTVETTACRFAAHSEWPGRVPLRAARLSRMSGQGARVVASPNFRRITRLVVRDDRFTDRDLAAMIALATDDSRLTELSLAGSNRHRPSRVSSGAVAALTRSPLVRRLTTLAVNSDGTLGSAAVRALSAGAGRGIRHLDLFSRGLDDRAARLLADGALPDLVFLSLRGCRVGDAGLRALVNAPGLPKLKHLGVWSSTLTPAGVSAVAGSPVAARLDRLELWSPGLGHSGGSGFASAVADVRRGHPGLAVTDDWLYFAAPPFSPTPELDRFSSRWFVDAAGVKRRGPWVTE